MKTSPYAVPIRLSDRTVWRYEPELMAEQRRLLGILQKLYAFPWWIHGGVQGRGAFSHALAHCRNTPRWILRMDLRHCFDHLSLPISSLPLKNKIIEAIRPYQTMPEVPQGSALSTLIANILLYKGDRSIQQSLRRLMGDELIYTRYIDDIAISFPRPFKELIPMIVELCRYCLYQLHLPGINYEKIFYLTPAEPQYITGFLINSGRPTIPRWKRKILDAVIHRVRQNGGLPAKEWTRLKGYLAWIGQAHPEYLDQLRQLESDIRDGRLRLSNYLPGKVISLEVLSFRYQPRKNKEQKDVVETAAGT